jgi:hypothetical protein
VTKNMTDIDNTNLTSFAPSCFCLTRRDNTRTVRFQILTAASMKMTVF